MKCFFSSVHSKWEHDIFAMMKMIEALLDRILWYSGFFSSIFAKSANESGYDGGFEWNALPTNSTSDHVSHYLLCSQWIDQYNLGLGPWYYLLLYLLFIHHITELTCIRPFHNIELSLAANTYSTFRNAFASAISGDMHFEAIFFSVSSSSGSWIFLWNENGFSRNTQTTQIKCRDRETGKEQKLRNLREAWK